MKHHLLHVLFLAVLVWANRPAPAADEKSEPVTIAIDVTDAPDLKPWAEKAKGLCEKWYPIISERLKSDGFIPPRNVTLIFKKQKKGIAATSGSKITINANWITDHPDDFGMVIHELTHVVQRYPDNQAGWLVEGIADYIRYWQFEPDKKPRVNPKKSSYRDGYGTAAAFLAWIEKNHDKTIVPKLNAALREARYKETLFKDCTGKSLEELWKAFAEE